MLGEIYHLERITDLLATLRDRADALAEIPPLIQRHRDTAGVARLAARFRELEGEAALAELEFLAGDAGALAGGGACLAVSPIVNGRAPRPGDWPGELIAMYAAWANRKGYEVEPAEPTDRGDLRLTIRGPNVAALLRGEAGLHRAHREPGPANGRARPRGETQLAQVEIQPLPSAAAEPPAPASSESHATELVRVYHFGRGRYVRDPRTGERVTRPDDVLAGHIDRFLLAYLRRNGGERTTEPRSHGATEME